MDLRRQIYLFITLFGGIYAMLLSVGVLARERANAPANFC
jgi:hypothetical protein